MDGSKLKARRWGRRRRRPAAKKKTLFPSLIKAGWAAGGKRQTRTGERTNRTRSLRTGGRVSASAGKKKKKEVSANKKRPWVYLLGILT